MNGAAGKTLAAVAGGALGTILIFVGHTAFDLKLPPDVQAAVQTLATAGIVHFFGGSKS